ncbi:MAG: YceI family protein [Nevskiaceae bacterium]|jgi:polyisoprenoid-binding protein YceI|nr:YceI family protein [Nevskiaceae bacterium]
MKRLVIFVAGCLAIAAAQAQTVTYNIDPAHTYPTFEADHMGGLSKWRGKINSSSGKVTMDAKAGTGTVDVTMDMASIDFGLDAMNEHARSADIFDVAKFPTATFSGKLAGFKDGAPTEVQGNLTLHGVTKPVTLKLNSFLCKKNPLNQKEVCGADALAQINRADFGVDYGKDIGFKMDVTLRISIEAPRAD